MRLRIDADWPAELVVSVNGTELEKVVSDDYQRMDDLRAQDLDYWIAADIDVSASQPRWTLVVAPAPRQSGGPSPRSAGWPRT